MKKIVLLFLLTLGIVKAEVLCVFDTQAWDATTTSFVRSTLSYSGNTWTGLYDAAIAQGDTSVDYAALNTAAASFPFDIDYAIYFAADASGCTHTLAGGQAGIGQGALTSVNTVTARTRAFSSATRLLKLKSSSSHDEEDEDVSEEAEDEELNEPSKFAFSVGMGTSMNDEVSAFDTNIIPIYVYVSDLLLSYVHTDASDIYGIGQSEIKGDSIEEWSINYSDFDFQRTYAIMMHDTTLKRNGDIVDFSFDGYIVYIPQLAEVEGASWADGLATLDYTGNVMVFKPLVADLYLQYGLNLGLNMQSEPNVVNTVRYGAMVGLSYMSNGFTFNVDTGYYGGFYTVYAQTGEYGSYEYSDWEKIPAETKTINFALNYTY